MTKKTLSPNEIVTEVPVGRRAAVSCIGGVALGAVALTLGATSEAHAIPGCTDQDPQDPVGQGRGRGISDSDPRDPAGCGSRPCSDSDPNDPAGRGRHC